MKLNAKCQIDKMKDFHLLALEPEVDIGVFPKWNGNLVTLIQFKDPVSYMCHFATVIASWSRFSSQFIFRTIIFLNPNYAEGYNEFL